MNRLVFGLVWICFVLFPSMVQAEVIGDGNSDNGIEDDRMPLITLGTELLRQLKPVGVIRCKGQVVGTAVIIRTSPKAALIITAGHVVAAKSADQCQFFPYNMFQGFKYQIIRQPDALKDRHYEGDWAILKVVADLTAFGAMPLAAAEKPVKQDRPAMLVAFDQGYNALAASQNDCVLLRKDKDGLAAGQPSVGLDSCDSGKGASGGAVLVPSKAGKLHLYGLRTGFLSRNFNSDKGDVSPKRGDKVDVAHFANAHHVVTAAIREQIDQADQPN